jgi:FkbM family methyltransferase
VRTRAKSVVLFRRLLHRFGFDLVRALEPDDLLKRRLQLISSQRVDVVFDVGAHAGQYGQTLRALGYRGRLVSFEPQVEPFLLLERATARDDLWDAVNVALGDHEGEVVMHISGNSQSSSVLEMLPAHEKADPDSSYVRDRKVRMTSLERMIREHVPAGQRIFVKIDAQGYEDQVLAGGGEAMHDVVGVQLELSLTPLYQGQKPLDEMLATMRSQGFTLMSLEPGFTDTETGQLLQCDGIFFRQ